MKFSPSIASNGAGPREGAVAAKRIKKEIVNYKLERQPLKPLTLTQA
jgi:hypothetical protein